MLHCTAHSASSIKSRQGRFFGRALAGIHIKISSAVWLMALAACRWSREEQTKVLYREPESSAQEETNTKCCIPISTFRFGKNKTLASSHTVVGGWAAVGPPQSYVINAPLFLFCAKKSKTTPRHSAHCIICIEWLTSAGQRSLRFTAFQVVNALLQHHNSYRFMLIVTTFIEMKIMVQIWIWLVILIWKLQLCDSCHLDLFSNKRHLNMFRAWNLINHRSCNYIQKSKM